MAELLFDDLFAEESYSELDGKLEKLEEIREHWLMLGDSEDDSLGFGI